MAWTDDRVDLIKRMWGDGDSAAQIAGRLGGVSRNAVIGKIHRLGLSGRFRPGKGPKSVRQPRRPHTSKHETFCRSMASAAVNPEKTWRAATEPLPPPHQTDIARKHLMDCEPTDCRFIIGDGKAGMCCAAESVPGQPYCLDHLRRCTVAPERGRRTHWQHSTGAVTRISALKKEAVNA